MDFINITEPGVPYNVRIAAVNRAGPGVFRESVSFTTELGISHLPLDNIH